MPHSDSFALLRRKHVFFYSLKSLCPLSPPGPSPLRLPDFPAVPPPKIPNERPVTCRVPHFRGPRNSWSLHPSHPPPSVCFESPKFIPLPQVEGSLSPPSSLPQRDPFFNKSVPVSFGPRKLNFFFFLFVFCPNSPCCWKWLGPGITLDSWPRFGDGPLQGPPFVANPRVPLTSFSIFLWHLDYLWVTLGWPNPHPPPALRLQVDFHVLKSF